MNIDILRVQNINKTFVGVKALNDVSFSIKKGEVHAIMGENGAGKSTMIKILTGVYKADSGQVFLEDKICSFKNVVDAQKNGISAIYQELNLIPELTVSENIFISRYPMRRRVIDWNTIHSEAQTLIDEIGVDIIAKEKLKNYGTAKQQIVAILRAISMDSKIVVMDEPTSSLDTNEVQILFEMMDKLKNQGISVIFISHRLDEVFAKSDSITILKDGLCMGTYKASDITRRSLVSKMIGSVKFDSEKNKKIVNLDKNPNLIEVKNLVKKPHVLGVSFSIKKGEVLGLAGLLGSGRTETARLLFGCDIPDDGEIYFEDEKVKINSPKEAVKLEMAFCTENRRKEGLFTDASLRNNLTVCALPKITKLGFIDFKKNKEITENYISKLSIKAYSSDQLVKYLSGGNQQKVILSRWLATNPKFIILDEPTRGIDVGAKQEIEVLIQEFAMNNIAVLLISSELPELVRNCNRVVVLHHGLVAGELTGEQVTEDNIMELIAKDKNLES